jgi:hypothetical protein
MFNKILIANRGGRAEGAGVRSWAYSHVSVTPDCVASEASGDRAAGD